jgi:fumarylacetoacetate (FAA) hydrolase family protein
MSATEVHERMADLARTIGSAYGRLHTELTTPLLRRVVHILKMQGRIEIPMVNGREVKVVNVSPLAQAQHNENVARVGRWLQLMNAGFGPQMTNMVVKAEEAAIYTGQQIGVPEKLIRDDAERAEIAQAVAETQELATQQQQGAL